MDARVRADDGIRAAGQETHFFCRTRRSVAGHLGFIDCALVRRVSAPTAEGPLGDRMHSRENEKQRDGDQRTRGALVRRVSAPTAEGPLGNRMHSRENDKRRDGDQRTRGSDNFAFVSTAKLSRRAGEVASAVRELSENRWYVVVFPVKYGKWGDREPFCFPDVNHFQGTIYADRDLADSADDQWPTEPKVRGSNPLGCTRKALPANNLRRGFFRDFREPFHFSQDFTDLLPNVPLGGTRAYGCSLHSVEYPLHSTECKEQPYAPTGHSGLHCPASLAVSLAARPQSSASTAAWSFCLRSSSSTPTCPYRLATSGGRLAMMRR